MRVQEIVISKHFWDVGRAEKHFSFSHLSEKPSKTGHSLQLPSASQRPLLQPSCLTFAPVESPPPQVPTEADLAGKDVNGEKKWSVETQYAQFLLEISSVLHCCCNEIHKRVSRG